jgi:hypothetical protein
VEGEARRRIEAHSLERRGRLLLRRRCRRTSCCHGWQSANLSTAAACCLLSPPSRQAAGGIVLGMLAGAGMRTHAPPPNTSAACSTQPSRTTEERAETPTWTSPSTRSRRSDSEPFTTKLSGRAPQACEALGMHANRNIWDVMSVSSALHGARYLASSGLVAHAREKRGAGALGVRGQGRSLKHLTGWVRSAALASRWTSCVAPTRRASQKSGGCISRSTVMLNSPGCPETTVAIKAWGAPQLQHGHRVLPAGRLTSTDTSRLEEPAQVGTAAAATAAEKCRTRRPPSLGPAGGPVLPRNSATAAVAVARRGRLGIPATITVAASRP